MSFRRETFVLTLAKIPRMHVFGLTGGIASGKSSVARIWKSLGLPIIDADQLAREVVEKGTPGLAEIEATFGGSVITKDGNLDRKALAALIFSDAAKRKRLNEITHPRIYALSAERARVLSDKGEPLACYEAALLVENGMADAFRPLVVVRADVESQVARGSSRDGASVEDVRARVMAQMPLGEKVAAADVVIDNNGPETGLENNARDALRAVCTKLAVAPARYGL
jgi:dephospho-CoA kinase